MAYMINLKEQNKKNLLIVDLGGGSFKISFLTIENKKIKVLATSENIYLGGEDFDQNIMRYFIDLFKKNTNKDMSNDKHAIFKLKREVENAKKVLSFEIQARIDIKNFYDGIDFIETLTRAKFEELNNEIFNKVLELAQLVIDDADMKKIDVDDIVVVGGSARIPRIQVMIKDFFGGKKIDISIDPDFAVASGVAIQAGIFSGHVSEKIKDIQVINITTLSLGKGIDGNFMCIIIPRGTVIPSKISENFTTVNDNQTSILSQIFEGERSTTKDNHKLGEIELNGISPAKRGTATIEYTYEIDSNGYLIISVVEKGTENKISTTINYYNKRLNKTEIRKNIRDAKIFSQQDKEARERQDIRNNLKSYTFLTEYYIEESINHPSKNIKDTIKKSVDYMISWLNSNSDTSKEDYQNKFKGMNILYKAITSDAYLKTINFIQLDKDSKSFQELKNKIESYVYLIMKLIKESPLNKSVKDSLNDFAYEIIIWLINNKNTSYDEYYNKLKYLEEFYIAITLSTHLDANESLKQDENSKSISDIKNMLELYAYFTKYIITKPSHKFSDHFKDIINKEIDETISWINSNPLSSKDNFKDKLIKIEELFVLSALAYSRSLANQNEEFDTFAKNKLELYSDLLMILFKKSVEKLSENIFHIIKKVYEDIMTLMTFNNYESEKKYQIRLNKIHRFYIAIAMAYIRSNEIDENDEEAKEKMDVINQIELYAYWIKKIIDESATKISEINKQMVNNAIDDLILELRNEGKDTKKCKGLLQKIEYYYYLVSSNSLKDGNFDLDKHEEL